MGFGKRGKKVKIVGSRVTYYTEYTTTTLYVEKAFCDAVNTINVVNDSSTDTLQISYDGATLDGDIKSGESIELHVSDKSSVYVKATTGGDKVRIWAW